LRRLDNQACEILGQRCCGRHFDRRCNCPIERVLLRKAIRNNIEKKALIVPQWFVSRYVGQSKLDQNCADVLVLPFDRTV